MYRTTAPPESSPIADWAAGEFENLEGELNLGMFLFVELHVAPTKPRTGLTVLADGTDWNPGSGAGVYTYYGSAWHKLG